MAASVLFAGLTTLDLVQSVERMPSPDEKVTALGQAISAGGPATNAAVTFSFLGGSATLLSAVGAHPLAEVITADLAEHAVRLVDLTPGARDAPAMSTIMVTRGTGDRAVVSVNAARHDLGPPPGLSELISGSRAVHVDGHHPRVARAAARLARDLGRLTVLDGGSWKPGTAELLPHIDVAVVSADFRPPGAETPEATLAFLRASGVRWAAVTRGPGPVLWQGPGEARPLPVPAVDPVDTLGAGDVFHGALTFALPPVVTDLTEDAFAGALGFAASVAAASCGSFGTRSWMRAPPGSDRG
ncbi:PfkB family carbohydrate kinase [Sphaerisporangium sp. NBC_01403]|uniref:PfkB family carbohydrate kinase n=1 Tax=Sphaerisporangium sp. NBC_01403 TaxID=2903599 RepID=UPI00325591E5